MHKLWRNVRCTQHLHGTRRLTGIEHEFRERDRRDTIARILLDESLAHGSRARGLSVPHEHPCGRQQKLSLISGHLTLSSVANREISSP